ncbi:flavin-containing monooxygenase [Alkalihalobacterium alkalinitrilicum]|uniref:flavin-containing monooxygenase n=1 Tax=Alkalihalobacterium alkalinitrilicum TaxID=427920 RepID=UPI001302EEA5|nr:NAD(P)/FAD-dependent oxidoreductase [Alkalihalobacterium alkalinitrilicum]
MKEKVQVPIDEEFDVIVIGAGFSGLYILKRLRDIGLSVKLYEAGDDVGGTWYWNRYPGARTDSDSMVYCFSDWFDKDIAHEWTWPERYSTQSDLLRYFRWVVDRLDLRSDIQFNTRVSSAVYDEQSTRWLITTTSGRKVAARYFVPAVGALSHPKIPDLKGLDRFQGDWYHSSRFPAEGVDFDGKRVAVIGSGATGTQIVPEVAKVADQVFHFIRDPYHLVPGRNHTLNNEDTEAVQRNIQEIWEYSRNTFGGFPYDFVGNALDFSPEERRRIYEKNWKQGGFPFLYLFGDVLADKEANETTQEFFREKIRQLVRDEQTADIITPKTPWLTKRPVLDHGYYAACNRDNVSLIDMKSTPIEQITEQGIRTKEGTEYDIDVIVMATGFESYTGSMLSMDIRGRNHIRLKERWADRPHDYLGITVNSFPNMFMLYCGPYNPAPFTNAPTLIEQQGEWIVDWIKFMRKNGYASLEPRQESEEEFFEQHMQIAEGTLIPQTSSWWTKQTKDPNRKGLLLMSWAGGFPAYRQLCDEGNAGNVNKFILTSTTE